MVMVVNIVNFLFGVMMVFFMVDWVESEVKESRKNVSIIECM